MEAMDTPPQTLSLDDDITIAYRKTEGVSPGVVYLGGFMSDMQGTKARMLDDHCRATGRSFLRFDYQGHGESSGEFTDGTIGSWARDAIAILDHCTSGPQLLVGSSMGGWIMLLAALARPERICALLGIAAAPDFTEDLLWASMDDDSRQELRKTGLVYEPAEEGSEDMHPITLDLVEEARQHLLLRSEIPLLCPVRLLQGMCDTVVPWSTPGLITEKLQSKDVQIHLIKEGDHRLSREQDLLQIRRIVDSMIEDVVQGQSPASARKPVR